MTYTKPTIEVLGEAARVIQGAKIPGSTDPVGNPTLQPNPPAYELDE